MTLYIFFLFQIELGDTSTNQEMAAPRRFVLRVFVATDVAMKLTLNERPQSVEELKSIMQDHFKPRLEGEFTLQYEDPDFDGQLSVLVDIQELPEKGTLKVMRSERDDSSTASSDTDILPHVPLTQRQKNWPDCFPLPVFSFEVEHVLQEGNTVFERSGKTVKLTRSQKHNILETMAEKMYSFKPYPSDKEVGMEAEALVTSYPCLSEPGSRNGWYGWKVSLNSRWGIIGQSWLEQDVPRCPSTQAGEAIPTLIMNIPTRISKKLDVLK